MLKKFGLTTLALAAALAVAVPTTSMAAERGDHDRGGRDSGRRNYDSHEVVRRDFGRRDFGRRDFDHDRGRGFGVGVYVAPTPVVPAPAVNGYYDQYGVWHPYTYYPQPYGYGR